MEDPEYRPKQKNYGVCGFWCLMLLFFVIVALVFSIVYLVVIEENIKGVPINSTAPNTGVCETPGCVELAASLISNVDKSTHPCDNFYQYACGSWLKTVTVPSERGRAFVPYFLLDELDIKLRTVLDTLPVLQTSSATMKATRMYSACMNKEKREENGLSLILWNTENELGGWPVLENNPGGNFDSANFDLTTLLTTLFNQFASSSLIHPEAVQDSSNPSNFNLVIKAGGVTGLPRESYLLDDTKYQRHQDAYVKYMTDIALAFGATDEKRVNLEMQALLALEKKLAQAKADSTPTPTSTMTLAEMSQNYPEIDWMTFLAVTLPGHRFTDDTTIINYNSQYLTAALDILNNEPSRLISDWLLWLYIDTTTLYLTDEVRNIYYDYSAVITGRTPNEYFQDCVKVTNRKLQAATGRLFIDQYFAGESKTLVEEMAADMVNVLDDLVTKSERFTQGQKQEASQTLKDMRINVGYPDFILNDDELDKIYQELDIPYDNALLAVTNANVWGIKQNLALLGDAEYSEEYLTWRDNTIVQVSADYNNEDNSLNLYVGLLQRPFFDKEFPWYMNYATLGMFTAQVASHALFGIVDLSEASDCIKTQYGDFRINGMMLNLDHTNNEDIADNAALQAAIQALMAKKQAGYPKSTLPGLDMTADQLFFLSNAQVWCDKYAPESLGYYLANNPESPGDIRLTGMFQNSEFFSEVFECPANSYMNGEDKCIIW